MKDFEMAKKTTRANLDLLGMILSAGCIVHCLLLPLIIPLLPTIGFAFDHESNFHLLLSSVILLTAIAALIPGYLKHKLGSPLLFASMGILLIMSMGILERLTESMVITMTTVIGSVLVIVGHYLNHKYSCACQHPRHKHGHDGEDSCR